jgi:hypothetical protein
MQIGENTHQHDVLDDVGEAAGMEGVTVVHAVGLRHHALDVIPGRAKARARNLEVPGSLARRAPRNDGQ